MCNRCHVEKGKFTGLNGECINCHGKWTQENFQHKITGLTLDETHSAMEWHRLSSRKEFSKPTCANCHDDKSYPKNVPGKLKRINESRKKYCFEDQLKTHLGC